MVASAIPQTSNQVTATNSSHFLPPAATAFNGLQPYIYTASQQSPGVSEKRKPTAGEIEVARQGLTHHVPEDLSLFADFYTEYPQKKPQNLPQLEEYPKAEETLPEGLTLEMICKNYPNHIHGPVLDAYIQQFAPALSIWRAMPDCRKTLYRSEKQRAKNEANPMQKRLDHRLEDLAPAGVVALLGLPQMREAGSEFRSTGKANPLGLNLNPVLPYYQKPKKLTKRNKPKAKKEEETEPQLELRRASPAQAIFEGPSSGGHPVSAFAPSMPSVNVTQPYSPLASSRYILEEIEKPRTTLSTKRKRRHGDNEDDSPVHQKVARPDGFMPAVEASSYDVAAYQAQTLNMTYPGRIAQSNEDLFEANVMMKGPTREEPELHGTTKPYAPYGPTARSPQTATGSVPYQTLVSQLPSSDLTEGDFIDDNDEAVLEAIIASTAPEPETETMRNPSQETDHVTEQGKKSKKRGHEDGDDSVRLRKRTRFSSNDTTANQQEPEAETRPRSFAIQERSRQRANREKIRARVRKSQPPFATTSPAKRVTIIIDGPLQGMPVTKYPESPEAVSEHPGLDNIDGVAFMNDFQTIDGTLAEFSDDSDQTVTLSCNNEAGSCFHTDLFDGQSVRENFDLGAYAEGPCFYRLHPAVLAEVMRYVPSKFGIRDGEYYSI